MSSVSGVSEASRLIFELETALVKGSADNNLLYKIQRRLDIVNAHVDLVGRGRDAYKLAELQALICAAQGRAQDSHRFMARAITLAGGFDNLSSKFLKRF